MTYSHKQKIPVGYPQPAIQKKRKGCGGWILTALLVFVSECVLIGVVALILAGTDVEIRGGLQDLKGFLSESTTDEAPSDITQPGPGVISLKENWLTSNFTTSFTQYQTTNIEGTSPTGTSVSRSIDYKHIEQQNPNWSSYSLMNDTVNGVAQMSSEYGITNGVMYTNLDNTCSATADPTVFYPSDTTPYDLFTSGFTGHVKLVEENVMMNGVVTDRYELRLDNFTDSDKIIKLISGDLYRARDGGYLVALDYVIEIQPQSMSLNIGQDFSETEPTQVTYHFDRTYAPDGTLTVNMPGVCAGQVP